MAHQRLDYVSTGGYLDQAAALPAVPGVRRGDLGSEGDNHLRDLRPQEGMFAKAIKSSHVGP